MHVSKEYMVNDINLLIGRLENIIDGLLKDVMEKHIHSPNGFPFVDAESVLSAVDELKEIKDYLCYMKRFYGDLTE